MMLRPLALLTAMLALSLSASAENTSTYTTYDLDKCRVISEPAQDEEFAGTWGCAGYQNKPDYQIVFSEGDLRSLVSFGKDGKTHCAASETFGGFNSVNNTVEWRAKDGKPFAAIQRWRVSYDPDDSSKIREWLVVTRIEPGNSCHIGYVLGALPKANELARTLADSVAATTSCMAAERVVLGFAGRDWSETPGGPACPQN
ncbi:MAG: hypothetical protein LCH46_08590 [Proteobacteria bacterium]|nr:hypothetical protein [Pseudomonadota bacterium]